MSVNSLSLMSLSFSNVKRFLISSNDLSLISLFFLTQKGSLVFGYFISIEFFYIFDSFSFFTGSDLLILSMPLIPLFLPLILILLVTDLASFLYLEKKSKKKIP